MSTIFAKTIARAISDYRQLLRKHLKQDARMAKLRELQLRDPGIFASESALYSTAWRIVRDIEKNMNVNESGYYAYSGVKKFCEYLKKYLNNYEFEGESVIHRTQKASRALLKAIQLISMSKPDSAHTEKMLASIQDCHTVIASLGSPEQHEMYRHNLEKHQHQNPQFLDTVLQDFQKRLQIMQEAA